MLPSRYVRRSLLVIVCQKERRALLKLLARTILARCHAAGEGQDSSRLVHMTMDVRVSHDGGASASVAGSDKGWQLVAESLQQ